MTEIRFWFAPGACSLAPHILLKEVGIASDNIETAISIEGAQFPAGFERINPKMRVPVLSLDGEIITEVPAIATAIAALAPERHLLGRTPLETARVYEWMVWISGSVHGDGFGGLWRAHRYTDDPTAHDGVRAKAREKIAGYFTMIDEKLVGPYALGEVFTAVDAYLYVFYRWGRLIGLDMNRDYPKFAALGRLLALRPAVVAAAAAEKLTPLPSENLDVVKRLYAAFARGDGPGALAEMHAEIEWNEAESFIYADRNPYRSPPAVAEGVFGRLVADWRDYEATAFELLDAGDTVVALGRSKGTHVTTGKQLDAQFAHIWRIREGKIAGFQQFIDTLQVWRATEAG